VVNHKGREEMEVKKARKPKALLDAERKIIELEKNLQNAKSQEQTWYKSYTDAKRELDGVHDVLDTLSIPRKQEGSYQDYPLSVRLFAWAMKK
jgi:hypothetical protein